MRLHSAAILYNPKKPSAKKLRAEVSSFLRAHGVKVLPPSKAQIIITLSGDGTILFNKNRFHKPFFGIGSHTSMLCNSYFEHWKRDLSSLIKNGFYLERRAMLAATLGGKPLPEALNEVVVRNRQHRLLHLLLHIGKKPHKFRADGVIISTATGSGAYAYSAGGKILPSMSWRIEVVPIAPHRREFKPRLVEHHFHVSVKEFSRMSRRAGKDGPGVPTKPDVVIDGQFMRPLPKGGSLKVRLSARRMCFVKIKNGRKA